jgi:DNA-binding transcriptional LysR family regulator
MSISEPSRLFQPEHRPACDAPGIPISDEDALCFLSIARYGTFVQTARRLNIKAPILRKKMQQLEERLGQALFMHKGHVLLLTRAAQVLQAQLNAQFPRSPFAVATAGQHAPVHLAVAQPLLHGLLSRDLVDYLRKNAAERLHIASFNDSQRLPTLSADVLVWSGAPQDRASVPGFADAESVKLASLTYVPHIAKRYAREPMRPTRLSDLDDFMLVQVLDDQQVEALKPWNDLVEQRQSALTRVQAYELSCTLITSGVCVGLLPTYMSRVDAGLAALPDLFRPAMVRDVWLAVHTDALDNPGAQMIVEMIRRVFHERREWFEAGL